MAQRAALAQLARKEQLAKSALLAKAHIAKSALFADADAMPDPRRFQEEGAVGLPAKARACLAAGAPPSSRTKWTRRVPHPVLIGHAASLTAY